MKKKLNVRNVTSALVMPGPSPQKAVIMPSGIRYNRAISVVSSASRNAKNIAVINAITMNEKMYRWKRLRKIELRMAEFIIPFRRISVQSPSWLA
jgi:hypothetical protein